MNKFAKNMGIYILVLVFIVLVLAAVQMSESNTGKEYIYSELINDIKDEKIRRIEITGSADIPNVGRAKTFSKSADIETVEIPNMTQFLELAHQAEKDYGLEIDVKPIPKTGVLVQFIPFILITFFFVMIVYFLSQQAQGGGGGGGGRMNNFGKSRARIENNEKNTVTFETVAGLEEEKQELTEVVDFLKQPKKYIDIGARIPKGILLVGPPGTGKTLLGKAVAGEAGVPFLSISGSDFVEMYVGVGASRVRDLFEQAKKISPSIIFIDEIDAVGRKRGAGLGGGHDEREQTLNQLLVEMDGFGVHESVIVLAATNRPDILDQALLRPGRFDRQVVVGKPDAKGREEILKVHAQGKRLAKNADLNVVARTTAGFTGADLENLLNEAALLAVRNGKKEVDMEELRRAFVKVGVGTEKKSRILTKKEKQITAYHEAGHAILFETLETHDPVHMVSIIPTGMTGGYTMSLPGDDREHISKKYMEEAIISLLGGRAAEFIVLKDITTGASNDIERASAIARSMVTKYGMSELLGPIQFGSENEEVFIGRDLAQTRNYGENVASVIDDEVKRIINEAYEKAKAIINENIDVLHSAAELLVEREKISGDDFRALFPEGKLKKQEFEIDF